MGRLLSIATMVVAGRAKALETMIDQCVIVRPAERSAMVTNPTTLLAVPASPVTVYEGVCRVKKPSTEQLVQLFGDTQVSVQRRVLRVPHDAPEVRIDDVFTATSSGDDEILRQNMRIAAVVAGSMNFYRDYGVELVGAR